MMQRVILIRCDGGRLQEIGTGHVVRCLALARGLVLDEGCTVVFGMLASEWVARVEQAGFRVEVLGNAEGLVALAETAGAQIVVLDDLGRSALIDGCVEQLKAAGRVVVSIDDEHNADRADVSVNPAFWGMGAQYEGFEYSILPSDAPESGSLDQILSLERDLVFASFGGFDAGGAVARFLKAWGRADLGVRCVLAVGPGEVVGEVPASVELVESVDLTRILPRALVAVTNGGTTMLMAAAMGAPVLAVAQYAHQSRNAERLADLGAAEYCGLVGELDFDRLLERLGQLLDDRGARETMALAGRRALPGFGRRDLVQIVGVVRKLEWDSNFFGRGIGCLSPKRLSSNILRFAEEQCEAAQIECLYFLCDGGDMATQALAQASSFVRVDQRLTYRIGVQGGAATAVPGVRVGLPEDGAGLADIAGDAYESSRYYFDRHFPRERCQQFYRDWILKSLDGGFDDVVLVVEVGGRLAGYISCRVESANQGRIGLVGIAPGLRGQGLGARLVQAAMDWFGDQGVVLVEVVTQGRNTSAQRLYEAAGFELEKTEVWFHRWFNR